MLSSTLIWTYVMEQPSSSFSDSVESDDDSSFTCTAQTYVEFHEFRQVICMKCGGVHIFPVSCGNRFCDVCSPGRRHTVRKKIDYVVSKVERKRGYMFKFLTFTIPNRSDLDVMIKDLIRSFRRLRQRALWRNKVLGGVYVVEITGRPGNWHAHIHVVIYALFMKWKLFHRLWMKVSLGRGFYILNLNPTDAGRYITKYLTKRPEIPSQVYREIATAIKGYRLFHPFGDWHGKTKGFVKDPFLCKKCGGDEWFCYSACINPEPGSWRKDTLHLSHPEWFAIKERQS